MKVHFNPHPKPTPKAKPPRKPIAKRSKKREDENKVYLMLREKFLKDNPRCAVFPLMDSNEVHHTYSGKDRDKYFLVVETWLPVSRYGHKWIHDHPKEARELNLLK